jgi:ribonuclease HI
MKAKRLRRAVGGISDMFVPVASPSAPKVILHTVKMCFDGGCLGNGHGYGSYAFWADGKKVAHERKGLGEQSTSNVAEWDTLRLGIAHVASLYDPAHTRIEIRGDSRIAVDGAARRWKVRAPHLRPIAEQVWQLLDRFAETDLQWWSRVNSVRILGH